jgi:hypothetical protein
MERSFRAITNLPTVAGVSANCKIVHNNISMIESDMEYDSYLQNCGDDDVISFGSGLYKIGKLKPGLASSIAKVADAIIESLEMPPYGITDAHMYEVPSRGGAYRSFITLGRV